MSNCFECGTELNDQNWYPSNQRTKVYCCKPCCGKRTKEQAKIRRRKKRPIMTQKEAWNKFQNEFKDNFRRIPKFANYAINDQGTEVWRFWDSHSESYIPKRKQFTLSRNGYLQVALVNNSHITIKSLHGLVCLIFNGNPTKKKNQVRHLNNNRQDNRAQNLVWGTAQENAFDRPQYNHSTSTKSLVPSIKCTLQEAFQKFCVDFSSDFKQIPNFENYVINKDGSSVYSIWKPQWNRYHVRKIKLQPDKQNKYLSVALNKNNDINLLLVHRVVMLTFGGPEPKPGMLVLHNDGNSHNNDISNLRWGTAHENSIDYWTHKRQKVGEICV